MNKKEGSQSQPNTLDTYGAFLETLPEAVLVVDDQGTIVKANAPAETMFGQDRKGHDAKITRYFKSPKTREMVDNSREVKAVGAGGAPISIMVTLKPLALFDGDFALVICRDVSDIKNIEKRLRRQIDEANDLARRDMLTGLGNYRYIHDRIDDEIERCQRHGRPFSLIYFDLDNFKIINDEKGHAEGDAVLRCVAAVLKSRPRLSDVATRIGGDEFVIVVPESDRSAAHSLTIDLQRRIGEQMRSHNWPVTASFGVATFAQAPDSAQTAISAADELMYRAKSDGKNNIIAITFD